MPFGGSNVNKLERRVVQVVFDTVFMPFFRSVASVFLSYVL